MTLYGSARWGPLFDFHIPNEIAGRVATQRAGVLGHVISALAYLWAFLGVTWLGLLMALLTLLTGGKASVTRMMPGRRIVIECIGGFGGWFVSKPMGSAGLTLGHTLHAPDRASMQYVRPHEWGHIRQCETFGPLFLPLYFIVTIWLWLCDTLRCCGSKEFRWRASRCALPPQCCGCRALRSVEGALTSTATTPTAQAKSAAVPTATATRKGRGAKASAHEHPDSAQRIDSYRDNWFECEAERYSIAYIEAHGEPLTDDDRAAQPKSKAKAKSPRVATPKSSANKNDAAANAAAAGSRPVTRSTKKTASVVLGSA